MGRIKVVLKRHFHASLGAIYLLTIGFFIPANRPGVAMLVEMIRGRKKAKTTLPDWSTQFINGGEIKILYPDSISGDISTLELVYICSIVRILSPKKIFEFGTFRGRTSLNLIANAPQDAELYTLDLPVRSGTYGDLTLESNEEAFVKSQMRKNRLFEGTTWESRVHQLEGNSLVYDFSPFAGNMELIFVDASHLYENVMKDTENALKMLASAGGTILWHDYGGWEGVTKALNSQYQALRKKGKVGRIPNTSLALFSNSPKLLHDCTF